MYPDTTTTAALGIDALLYVQPFEMLWESDKPHARRVTVNGRDLVAKIVDFYRTPRHTGWSAETLFELEWAEVRGYHALKALQGRFGPESLYHGSDLNHLWATVVTTYEGVSLYALVDQRGKVPHGAKARAKVALQAMHGGGVLHGDIALRNAVWRERDGAVLWVDLERSKLRAGHKSFVADAQREMRALDELLEQVEEAVAENASGGASHSPTDTVQEVAAGPQPLTAKPRRSPSNEMLWPGNHPRHLAPQSRP